MRNADHLRIDKPSVRFVTAMVRRDVPIGVICHGAWILIEAWAVNGRTITSYPSLRTDLQNAGAHWVDEEVHNDHGLVSSRNRTTSRRSTPRSSRSSPRARTGAKRPDAGAERP